MVIIRDKFDFEIGYFVKSPCKTCDKKDNLPSCSEKCKTLDKIHTILAKGISCTHKSSNT